MKVRSPAILLLWILPGVCAAQVRPRPGAKPAEPPAFMQQLKSYNQEGAVTKAVLKNDLTVLVVEAHTNPLVEALVWVNVGRLDDPPDLKGISRMVERMLARGTTNRTARVLADDLDALGGQWNSATGYDHTTFSAVVPASQWKRALELQADILLNPLLDAREIPRQMERMGFEERMNLEARGVAAYRRLLGTGFAGDRLAAGAAQGATLPGLTREKLAAFYQAHYTANRILYVVCGDVTAAEAVKTIVDLHGKSRAVAANQSRGAKGESRSGLQYAQIQGPGRPAHILVGFHTPPAGSADGPALDVLRAILGVGESSVVLRRLKYDKGLIYDATADHREWLDTGLLSFDFVLDPGNLDRCEIAAFTEFEILKKQPPDDTELARAKAQAQREYWEDLQTVSGRARQYARHEAAGAWKDFDAYPAKISRVKWSDVARVAADYLSLANCAIVETLPTGEPARNVTAETLQRTIKDLLEPSTEQEMAAREKETTRAWELPGEENEFRPSETRNPFQIASILRGPELFIREDHTLPLLHIGFFYSGGKVSETKENSGITRLMLRTMLRDTSKRTADELYRRLETCGALLVPVVQDDYFGVQLSVPSVHAERGLEILTEMIKSPKMEPQEIERQKRLQSAAVLERAAPESGRLRVTSALFGNHAYALDTDGTAESLASLTPEAVRKWHAELVENRKPKVVIIGDTAGTALAAFFVRNFSGSRFEDPKIPEAYPKPPESKPAMEHVWDRGTSRIMLGFQAPPEGDDDSFPVMVLRRLATGLGGRLEDRFEAELPGPARVSIEYVREHRSGTAFASVATEPKDEDAASKLLVEEIGRLATAPVTYRDYRVAVNAAVGDFEIRQQDRFRQIGDLLRCVIAGEGLEGYQDYVNRLQEVRQADLQEVARRIFRMDKSVTLRLHGKTSP